MSTRTRLLIAAIVIASPSLITLAQLNVAPPNIQPASEPATRPATRPASTLPSAQSVFEGLLRDKPNTTTALPLPAPASTNPALTPAFESPAPREPKANRLVEGQILTGTGRLIKDDKTNTYVFTFDSDGKQMHDPPIALLPSRSLMSMEEASDNGTRDTKFKISGDVTEFHGKNYLHVRPAVIIRDLNQGLGC